MKNWIVGICICSVLISCGNNQKTAKSVDDISKTNIETINEIGSQSSDSIVNQISTKDLSYKSKTIDGQTWMPVDFLKSIYTKGIHNTKRNNNSYPFESVFIENWKDKKIYAESAGLGYRKIRVLDINDSTYYVTSWNKHHYKEKDSVFIAKRNDEISFMVSSDSISYISGIGIFPFGNASLTENIHKILLYNKTFDVIREDETKIDSQISFDLSDYTIKNSNTFKRFNLTPYDLNEKYLIVIDSTKYFFNWNGNDIHMHSDKGDHLILKQIM